MQEVAVVATTVVALLLGYMLGRHHQKTVDRERLPKFLVRPHTAETIVQYPLPEETPDPAVVQDVQWGSKSFPNSGVRWE